MSTATLSRPLSSTELEAFGAELDALRTRTQAQVGEVDARYIRRMVKAVRYFEVAGRALLVFGLFPPAWLLGTLWAWGKEEGGS